MKVLPAGFEYEGEVYKSLSAVAKKITGSHCNGYLFFRLTATGTPTSIRPARRTPRSSLRLAFYTKDAAQIDRLFRQSGLMRDKWDELHGEQTYGETTIAKALAKVTKQYEPKRRRKIEPSAPPPPRIPACRPSSSTTRSSAS